MSLDRYRDIVPDWDGFLEAAGRPAPTTIRVRTGRVSPPALRERLADRGFRLEEVDGVPGFLRVTDGPRPVSDTLEHWLGLFYVQKAVTGLAAPALAPEPGEHVLDMCAAPGGKTTHVAELMEDRGCLVASDASDGRIPGLLGNLYRLGHTGAVCVKADGRTFPAGARFDRVLVDAPCSAEGNLRGRGGALPEPEEGFREHVTEKQHALLRRAVELARPGGVVLYVTCTFAPEENEAVVERVLEEADATLEPIGLDVPHARGLTEFEGRSFDPELRKAWRLYPHHLDSGGLFMARLLKAADGAGDAGVGPAGGRDGGDDGHGPGDGDASEAGGERPPGRGWSDVPAAHPEYRPGDAGERVEAGMERLGDGFGVPAERLRSASWFVRGNSVWTHSCAEWPVETWLDRGGWRFVCMGLRALTRDARFGERPTNDALRWLDGELGDRVAELEPAECRELLSGERLPRQGLPDGNVALEMEGHVVGRGVAADGELRHEIPRARARRLAEILERSADD